MTSDLYPTKLVVKNLYCFKGTHTIKLDATIYAVLAQAIDNPARSNWLGKSTLLMAFALALFGWHTKRTDDEIITDGEEECSVELVLNDGSKLGRTKARGKSMQVRFTPKGKKALTQAAAQQAIEAHIGFTQDDFFATCYFEQKQIGALVTAKGAERSAIVEGWLAEELAPIQRLHGAAVREHKVATESLRALEEELANLETDWAALVEERAPGSADLVGHLDAQLCAAEAARQDKRQALAEARKVVAEREAEARAWEAKVRQAEEYEAIVARGVAKRQEFDALPADADARRKAADLACGQATSEAEEAAQHLARLELADYQFDGQCPIACQTCPSAQWVEEQATSPEALDAAKERAAKAEQERKVRHQEAAKAGAVAGLRSRLETELVQLRTKAEQLMDVAAEVDEAEEPPSADELEVKVAQLEGEVEALAERARLLREDIEWAGKADARRQVLGDEIAQAKVRHQVASEAVEITGRTGAQQAIQELVMAKVERRANHLLASAGIPLQVSVSWAQETKGLAKVCSCGTAFPTSQRVKECTACGATRGANMQRKLSIEPSNRSGAAEDLAGIALGIAASQWLRAARGSRWATVFIDEPFGALDQHNRAALSSHIVSMLRTAFASAFVVAHERAILSAMPARINILAGPDGSQIQGEAA